MVANYVHGLGEQKRLEPSGEGNEGRSAGLPSI